MRPNLILPNKLGAGANESLDGSNNIVIVGANGSGKTRLGSWLEFKQPADITVHRISAQRALNIPESAEMKTLESATKGLLFGDWNGSLGNKQIRRWGSQLSTRMLSDYDKLLSTLFAKTNKRDSDHAAATKAQQIYIPVPDAPIDTITKVWQDIMPQNSISFNDGKVMVTRNGMRPYHGKEMSDGERVALYLLGQCLCTPDNAIIIIDEPEIHLHKAIMVRLWNKIEELSPNKLIVYITHDLDFAASKKAHPKFGLKTLMALLHGHGMLFLILRKYLNL